MPIRDTWDDRRIAILRSLWQSGWSGSRIGAYLGVSRNAVIGKINRLGLSLSPMHRAARQAVNNVSARHKRSEKQKAAKLFPPPRTIQFKREPLPPIHVEDVARFRNYVDLPENGCQYHKGHVGEQFPEAGFCGLERIPNSAYCHGHHQRCWTAVPARTNRPFDASVPVKHREPENV